MNFNLSLFCTSLSLILGSVASVTAFAATANAAPSSMLNPCPGIYYEEPHNSLRIVPHGCPPNAATRLRDEQSQLPGIAPATTQMNSPQSLSPVDQQPAITTITLQSGKVNVRLKNTTNTSMTYQAIGDMQQRTLMGGAEVMLQNLRTPVTITFLRPDGGLVSVQTEANYEPGMLGLMLNEAKGLSDSQNTVRIQSSGQVLAY